MKRDMKRDDERRESNLDEDDQKVEDALKKND